ncbi:MAG: T9SS type A sorting domain-containing protein, partial [Bacteroidetes bacterium]
DNYLDPADDYAVIGSSQYGNFYLSPDGGITGTGIGANVNSESAEWVTPIVADYNNPGTLYAGFSTIVTQSLDGGNTWSGLSPLPSNGINDNEMTALAVANTNANVIYATRRIRFEFSSPGGVYRTTNGGNTWTDITSALPDSLYYTSIDVSYTDANTAYVAMAGLVPGVKVFKTNDAGATWKNISFNLPNAPVNCIKTVFGSSALLAGTDFGVYRFDAASSVWTNESSGLPNVIVSDIEFNAVLDKAYVATFGRGIWETTLSSLLSGQQDTSPLEAGISLYPNPNSGSFTIALLQTEVMNESLQLEIIDIAGRTVFSKRLEGKLSYRLNLKLDLGMYFAKVKNKKLNGVKSFVIQ